MNYYGVVFMPSGKHARIFDDGIEDEDIDGFIADGYPVLLVGECVDFDSLKEELSTHFDTGDLIDSERP